MYHGMHVHFVPRWRLTQYVEYLQDESTCIFSCSVFVYIVYLQAYGADDSPRQLDLTSRNDLLLLYRMKDLIHTDSLNPAPSKQRNAKNRGRKRPQSKCE